MDDVTPLSSSAAAEQTLWSSDFWRDCMAPKIVTFKVIYHFLYFVSAYGEP